MLVFDASGTKIPVGGIVNESATAAADTAVVITLAAVPGVRHIVHAMQWSYSATPTGGRLTVTGLKDDDWDIDITTSIPGGYNSPLVGEINTAVVVTLAAGSGTVVGKLNIQRTEARG